VVTKDLRFRTSKGTALQLTRHQLDGINGKDMAYVAEFVKDGLINLAHFNDESDCSEQHPMVPIRQKVLGFGNEMIT
jgi:hypothetical protein